MYRYLPLYEHDPKLPRVLLFRHGEHYGAIALTGKLVEGTYKQNAWDDTAETEHEIRYTGGELTDEVCNTIRTAWNASKFNERESSWGRLRWSNGRSITRFDKARRVAIVFESVSLCD